MEMSEDQNAQLVEQLNSLNLSQELEELSGSQSNAINSQAVAIFQQWLVKKSSCPVNFKWIDLGEYFWPRWIRQGACEKNNQNQTNTNNESLFETTQTAESFEETIAGKEFFSTKGGLISDLFFILAQNSKNGCHITLLSTLHLKKRCTGE